MNPALDTSLSAADKARAKHTSIINQSQSLFAEKQF